MAMLQKSACVQNLFHSRPKQHFPVQNYTTNSRLWRRGCITGDLCLVGQTDMSYLLIYHSAITWYDYSCHVVCLTALGRRTSSTVNTATASATASLPFGISIRLIRWNLRPCVVAHVKFVTHVVTAWINYPGMFLPFQSPCGFRGLE